MRQFWILISLLSLGLLTAAANNPHGVDTEDNDFAEFEDFEDEDAQAPDVVVEPKDEEQKVPINEPDLADEDDATVEDEEDEFEHLQDDEEFIGYDKESRIKGKGNDEPHKLKINTVPYHLRTNWDSFYMEMLMLAGLGVYFLNFLAGKSKNSRLAQAWFNAHKELLDANFTLVGDDGQSAEAQGGEFIKESENVYSLWCSGRVCCEGMLVTLKLLKRQDLVGTIARMFKPASDQIVVKVTLDEGEMDSYVFCIANKKVGPKLHKDMNDLSFFCTEKKGGEKYDVPSCFQVFSEMGEATAALLDRQTKACLNRYENQVEFIHISDQYSGIKSQDDSQTAKAPEIQRVLIFCFNVANKGNAGPKDMESMKPLMQLVFHCLDRCRRIRLSRESKVKAERNRQRVSEGHLKASHAQRNETAQARREEKRRAEKERIMAEEDPDKQRKWEERENRREMKKKQPKVKMMKIKAM